MVTLMQDPLPRQNVPVFLVITVLGPVVQSTVSLMSSLRGQLIKFLQL